MYEYTDLSHRNNTMKNTLLDKVFFSIRRSKDNVFVLRDFDDLVAGYDYDQVLRALGAEVMTGGGNEFYKKIGYQNTRIYMHFIKG